MATVKPPRARRTWPERLLLVVGVLVAVAMAGAIYVLDFAQDKASQVQRIAIGGDVLAEPVTNAEARNILVVGIDSAEGLDPDDPRAATRPDSILTDTMMIVRIDPPNRSVSILSIPRDLVVSISGVEYKANAAMAIGGGPDAGGIPLLIETIDENFGIPINSYVEVDFAAFLAIVDAIGGVPFYLEHPVRDIEGGLLINQSGCVTFGPDDALAFVRSRKSFQELIDGEWRFGDGTDLARIDRQQEFVVAMVERAISKGARNPITLNSLLDATIPYVVLDTFLTVDDLLQLGDQFRTFRAENLQTMTFNGIYFVDLRGSSAIRMNDTPENQAILAHFAGDAADTAIPTPTPEPTVTVEATVVPEPTVTVEATVVPEPTVTVEATVVPEPTPDCR